MTDSIAALPTTGTVRILSDLHLGHDMSIVRDISSLRPLIAGARHLIFNGDTLQEREGPFRQKSLDLLAGLQALCAEEGVTTTWLRGNHDPTHWALELLDLMDGQVTITHGDVWLRLISPWSVSMKEYRPVLEAIHDEYSAADRQDLATRLEILQRCRLALPPSHTRQRGQSLTDRAGLFFREIWPPKRPWEVLKVYAQLPSLASEFAATFRPRSRVLLFGHTHRAKVWRRSQRLLINTGAFVTFAKPLMVEIKDRLLTAHPLTEKNNLWQKEPPIASQPLD